MKCPSSSAYKVSFDGCRSTESAVVDLSNMRAVAQAIEVSELDISERITARHLIDAQVTGDTACRTVPQSSLTECDIQASLCTYTSGGAVGG